MISVVRARALFGLAALLLFAASATATVLRYTSMATMSGTPMPGGWTLSATWLPLCGRTWLQTAVAFVAMWSTMMPAMMLPALAPMLWRERGTLTIQSGWLTIVRAIGYFSVWLFAGVVVFPLGAAMASLAVREPSLARLAPGAAGIVVVLAGLIQCTLWKAKRLASCHSMRGCHDKSPMGAPPMGAPPKGAPPMGARVALREGTRLALHCLCCCGNWMAVLLATGVMDRQATLIVSAVIAVERLASRGPLVRIVGMASIGAGVMLIAHAL
ncbi:DUF2182 domain-containing protein [Paraburkholderia sp. J67]|uniref:DUF2182 domain-containing protein n=1 Tax=Paraburkholderia sp. J67 TaxID=2805435 RepID=UPI002ABE7B2F|nr:DUF2182 domain-containing protein [Paraburkholderia sp. J67]